MSVNAPAASAAFVSAPSATSRTISASALRAAILHGRGVALRCQLPGHRIGCTTDLLDGSPPTIRAAKARARLSLAKSPPCAGMARRQCRCSRSSASPFPFDQRPPLRTTTVAGPRMPSRTVRACCGCWSHSTLSAKPSAISCSRARPLPTNVAIGGQYTTGSGACAARRASSSATSIKCRSPPDNGAGTERKTFCDFS